MKNLDYAFMLEIYGSMLTEKQRNFMELYYWEDLSLGEISQAEGLTRQAVRDSIKRSEHILSEFEANLRIAEKIGKCKEIFGTIYELAGHCMAKGQMDCENYAEKIKAAAKCGSEIF